MTNSKNAVQEALQSKLSSVKNDYTRKKLDLLVYGLNELIFRAVGSDDGLLEVAVEEDGVVETIESILDSYKKDLDQSFSNGKRFGLKQKDSKEGVQ